MKKQPPISEPAGDTLEKSSVVKKSISLSSVVAAWGDEQAAKKGFGSNYSAYIADLIRRDKERDQDLQLSQSSNPHFSPKQQQAADEIVAAVDAAAQQKNGSPRRR